jgi:uncharacterized cupredoxin-like copper-binding protein
MKRGAPAAAGLLIAALLAVGCAAPTEEVTITIHFSAFEPAELTIPAGEPVAILLRNEDPIDHEWIVGDAALHERHRTGTEPWHATRPTEVSVPALEDRRTTVAFEEPGDYPFICHIPGHEAYGMVGVLHVTAAPDDA